MMTTPRTIDMTPTFAESACMILAILENGNEEGKRFARSEVIRWGEMLDKIKAQQEASK
jgi:hypothetical protein